MIKHLILGGLCHIHSTPVSGPIHYLHSPLHHWLFHPETLTPNSAVRDIVQGKEFGMPAALSPGPKFNMSHPVPKYSKHKNDVIRRHTTSYDVMWISLPHFGWSVGRLVIHFLGPRWTQEDCPKAESIGSGSSNINVWTKPANRCHWHSAEHIQAHNCWSVLVFFKAEITGRLDGDLRKIYLAHRLPFCHQQLVQGIKETCG